MIFVQRECDATINNYGTTSSIQFHQLISIIEVRCDSDSRTIFRVESNNILVSSFIANAGVRIKNLLFAADKSRVVATDSS